MHNFSGGISMGKTFFKYPKGFEPFHRTISEIENIIKKSPNYKHCEGPIDNIISYFTLSLDDNHYLMQRSPSHFKFSKEAVFSQVSRLIPLELEELICAYIVAMKRGDIEAMAEIPDQITAERERVSVFIEEMSRCKNKYLNVLLDSNLVYQNIKSYSEFIATFTHQISQVVELIVKCSLEVAPFAMGHAIYEMKRLINSLNVNYAGSRYEEYKRKKNKEPSTEDKNELIRKDCNLENLIKDIYNKNIDKRSEWLPDNDDPTIKWDLSKFESYDKIVSYLDYVFEKLGTKGFSAKKGLPEAEKQYKNYLYNNLDKKLLESAKIFSNNYKCMKLENVINDQYEIECAKDYLQHIYFNGFGVRPVPLNPDQPYYTLYFPKFSDVQTMMCDLYNKCFLKIRNTEFEMCEQFKNGNTSDANNLYYNFKAAIEECNDEFPSDHNIFNQVWDRFVKGQQDYLSISDFENIVQNPDKTAAELSLTLNILSRISSGVLNWLIDKTVFFVYNQLPYFDELRLENCSSDLSGENRVEHRITPTNATHEAFKKEFIVKIQDALYSVFHNYIYANENKDTKNH